MHAGTLFRARAVRTAGLALAVAGAALVLYAIALLVSQAAVYFDAGTWVALPASLWLDVAARAQATPLTPLIAALPELPSGWLAALEPSARLHAAALWLLAHLHLGLVPALAGAGLLRAGMALAAAPAHVFAAARERRLDRLRRAQHYREMAERKEPVLVAEPEMVDEAPREPRRVALSA